MNRYRIVESVGHRTEPVHRYEDLEIHHPSANALGLRTGRPSDFEKKRSHERVEARFEEVRHTPDGRVLVKKDFILSQDGEGPVHVPSPVEGYVHYLRDKTCAVRIYDRPPSAPGARLLAQSLHMDPRTFGIPEGHHVDYGQPLGAMSDRGTPGSIHAHVEVEVGQFRRYVRDIDNGVIAPGHWPARNVDPPAASVTTEDMRGANTAGHRQAARTHRMEEARDVAALQSALNRVGARDAHGAPLAEDGKLGRHTREAVEQFQKDHGLPATGHAGSHTRAALDSAHGPRLSDRAHPHYSLFEKTLALVAAAEARQGMPMGQHTENLAGALVVQMKKDGMHDIDRVDLSEPPRFVRAVRAATGGHGSTEQFSLTLDTRIASKQSLHASSDMLAQSAAQIVTSVEVASQSKRPIHSLGR